MWPLLFTALLAGCMQPVRRDSPRPTASPVPLALQDGDVMKRRIWILGFKAPVKPPPEDLKETKPTELLHKNLVRTFSKPASPFVTDVTDEASFQDLNLDSTATAADITKLARGSGVGGFLKGEITDYAIRPKEGAEGLLRSQTNEIRVAVDFELYDGMTGRKLYSGSAFESLVDTHSQFLGDSSGPEDAVPKMEGLVRALSEKIYAKLAPLGAKLGWQGRVVRMDGPRIFINAGRRTGLQVGDMLKVIDRTKEIIDPQTGALVGEAPGRMKATLKVMQHFGIDGAMTVLISGGGVTAGDRVEIY